MFADLGGGVRMRYSLRGSGFPVVLIMGFGATMDLWGEEFLNSLARQYQVLCFDNRGVGGSVAPDATPSIPLYARDTTALMDHLGISQAHILGISMGGMIAQEIAVTAPQRIAKLVLGCTTASSRMVRKNPALLGLLFFRYAPRFAMRAFLSDAYIKAHPAEVDRLISVVKAHPASTAVTRAHSAAVKTYDLSTKVASIDKPTLLIAGTADKIINYENSEYLAQQIKGSRLVTYPGVGHMFPLERSAESQAEILKFLAE